MPKFVAVLLLTVSQFTAFPFVAIVASNSARHGEAVQAQQGPNVTVVYKTDAGRSFETL